mmetsp:Transcript_8995/g.28066  ORF Transcript_8995/g.28066 Transcript_8995/m.28066 type:complete len:725 (-) Transcript_8995:21-2195(-)
MRPPGAPRAPGDAETTPPKQIASLPRAVDSKGSLGSLASLLSDSPLSPLSQCSVGSPPARAASALRGGSPPHRRSAPQIQRLSQSYSHAAAGSLRAVEEERIARRGAVAGALERRDGNGKWRPCEAELRKGDFAVFAPDARSSPTGSEPSVSEPFDDFDGDLAGFSDELEELAVAAGARGRRSAVLALSKLRVVGTAPQHGPGAFRLVLDDDRRVFLRAHSYDDMCAWLLGFHRSLAAVVAKIREARLHQPASPPRNRAASADAGQSPVAPLNRSSPSTSADSPQGFAVHKKSARRRRSGLSAPTTPEKGASAPRFPPPPDAHSPPPPPPPIDDGAALYRKSSARPFRGAGFGTGKYVPPHLRAGASKTPPPPPPADDFEETGGALEGVPDASAAWRDRNGLSFRSGCVCDKGPRRANEDAFAEAPDATSTTAYFGVYDGHSGKDVASRCAAELHGRVASKLEGGADPADAVASSFLELDEDYCAAAAAGAASPDAGATALAIVLDAEKRELVAANCGDCAAVLCRDGSSLPLTTAHAPTPGSSERARVEAAGGWVTSETDLCVGRLHSMDLEDPEISASASSRVRLNEIHRVCGEVAVSRALGDVDFKGWGAGNSDRRPEPCFAYPEDHPRRFSADLLVAAPEVTTVALTPGDAFVLIATDGLWDVVEPDEAVRVAKALLDGGATPAQACARMVDRALRLGSGDNVTVLLVQLEWSGPGAAGT